MTEDRLKQIVNQMEGIVDDYKDGKIDRRTCLVTLSDRYTELSRELLTIELRQSVGMWEIWHPGTIS